MDKTRSIYKSAGYLLFLFVIIALSCPANTRADQNIRINVKTILASSNKDFVDPGLKSLVSELQSVFRYSSYEFLNEKGLSLSTNKKGVVSLPEGRVMNIFAKGVEGNRVILEIEITKDNSRIFQTIIKLRNNSSITIGGPRYKGGNLLFNIFASF
jgi:hypothetical protein